MDHVLIANQAALPALFRRLERLSGGRAVVLAERTVGEPPLIDTPAGLKNMNLYWVAANGAFALNEALRGLHLPQGQTLAWVSCPPVEAELIRCQLIEDHGVKAECITIAQLPAPLRHQA